MKGRRRNCGFKAGGQALVETALILPLLLIIVFGIIELGVAFNRQLLITTAAREGCRVGVVGAANQDILDRVYLIAPFLDVGNSIITLNPDQQLARVASIPFSVTIDYNHSVMTPFVSGVLGVTIPLAASTTMRVE